MPVLIVSHRPQPAASRCSVSQDGVRDPALVASDSWLGSSGALREVTLGKPGGKAHLAKDRLWEAFRIHDT